jgi:hypothetical protein
MQNPSKQVQQVVLHLPDVYLCPPAKIHKGMLATYENVCLKDNSDDRASEIPFGKQQEMRRSQDRPTSSKHLRMLQKCRMLFMQSH